MSKKSNLEFNKSSTSQEKNSSTRKEDSIKKGASTSKGNEGTSFKRNTNPYNHPTLGKCFRCGQQGHLSNECPQRRTLIIQEEENSDQEHQDLKEDANFLLVDDGDQLLCIIQKILLTPKTERHHQRNALFPDSLHD